MATLRYKLRPFSAADSPEDLLTELSASTKGSSAFLADKSGMAPWAAVVKTFQALGAKCLLIQRGVRDPDFLEEHQAFYAKQHRPVSRSCTRVHAFALAAPDGAAEADEEKVLKFLDEALLAPDAYLGFATIRPLRHAPVGATIITAPGAKATTSDDFPVHIAGNAFSVTGTPFLQQDNAVGACAQASIWMALRTLRRRHGNAAYSPAELTVAATRYLAPDRSFPGRQGLTLPQMLEAIRFAGHDPLHLSLRECTDPPLRPGQTLSEAVPYLESGLPVVLALMPKHGGHAVVAIGCHYVKQGAHDETHQFTQNGTTITYSLGSNWVSSLLIHNDNSGPYLELAPGQNPAYSLDDTVSLIVALPEGVFTTAAEAELLGVRALLVTSAFFSLATLGQAKLPELPFLLRRFLCTRHAFRSWAKDAPGLDPLVRQRYRTHELPKYMWVIEIHDASIYDPTTNSASRCGELVIDASADPFHADGLIFANLSAQLWPSAAGKGVAGILLSEDEEGINIVATTVADKGPRLEGPWR